LNNHNADIYEIIVTRRCNWNCVYCSENCNMLCADMTTLSSTNMDLNKITNISSQIPSNKTIRLSGGEVGLLDRNEIENIIQIFRKEGYSLHINTNGTFIRKYSDLLHNFDKIIWHISEHLDHHDLEKNDKIIADIGIDNQEIIYKIERMIVVSDSIMHKLDDFMGYIDFPLHVINSTMPKKMYRHGEPINDILSHDNIRNIIKKKYKNMTMRSKLFISGVIPNMDSDLNHIIHIKYIDATSDNSFPSI